MYVISNVYEVISNDFINTILNEWDDKNAQNHDLEISHLPWNEFWDAEAL